jgi:hypothetical protein
MSRPTASANAGASFGGMSRPVDSLTIISGMPPTLQPTTGRPAAIALSAAFPKGSDVRRHRDDVEQRNQDGRIGSKPENSCTKDARPSTGAMARR